MSNPFKSIKNLYRERTPLECAVREMAEAQLAKLEAESARDYATSIVAYNTMRIKRLQEYINAQATDQSPGNS